MNDMKNIDFTAHEHFTPLVDAHVHIYPSYNVTEFLDNAWENFRKASRALPLSTPITGMLLLSESSGCDWFSQQQNTLKNDGQWQFQPLPEEPMTLLASNEEKSLLIVAGRQVITAEGLEVLALLTKQQFDDGQPLTQLLEKINENDGLAVLPWAVGKWLGGRGKRVSELLASQDSPFMLGDNGGRPVFWRNVPQFIQANAKGIRILPGSDPLPLTADASRAGSFGFTLSISVSSKTPAQAIHRLLLDSTVALSPYGCLQGPIRFLQNQLSLRFSSPASPESAS